MLYASSFIVNFKLIRENYYSVCKCTGASLANHLLLCKYSFSPIAEVYLLEGNKEYKNKELLNAIYFYTEGLQVNCKDDKLNAKLYSNRATAYFHSGEILFKQFLFVQSLFNYQ